MSSPHRLVGPRLSRRCAHFTPYERGRHARLFIQHVRRQTPMSHPQRDTQREEPATIHNRLEEALAMLSPISRRVIEWWLAGLSKPQIAMKVGLVEDDVSQIGHQAIQQVRDLLASSSHDRLAAHPADSRA